MLSDVPQTQAHRGICSLDLRDIQCHKVEESHSLVRLQIEEGFPSLQSARSIQTTGVRSL